MQEKDDDDNNDGGSGRSNDATNFKQLPQLAVQKSECATHSTSFFLQSLYKWRKKENKKVFNTLVRAHRWSRWKCKRTK